MSRESKIFTTSNKAIVGRRVKEYESFGWELLSINGVDVSMSRETQNPVYAQLVKFEYEYDVLRAEQDALVRPIVPARFSIKLALLGLIALVIPGGLYIYFKIKQKSKYDQDLQLYNETFESYEKKIKDLCDQSRTVFFSKQ